MIMIDCYPTISYHPYHIIYHFHSSFPFKIIMNVEQEPAAIHIHIEQMVYWSWLMGSAFPFACLHCCTTTMIV